MTRKVIPHEFIPDAGGELVRSGGRDYLLQNDAMFTFYRRSMGELSPFFLALRDERKIYGARCPRCGIVRVPPMMQRCPDCAFAALEWIEMADVGEMLQTPPITYFANALFQKQVPFGRGRVLLRGADTALSANVYTTRGILVPGLIRKGTEVKVVFRDERWGEVSDLFCVPTSELAPGQASQRGLLESELEWKAAVEPSLPAAGTAERERFTKALAELRALATELRACERSREDIAGWRRRVRVRTLGGELGLTIDDGDFEVAEEPPETPDFTLVCPDPALLVAGFSGQESFTQAIMEGKLWLSRNDEFLTVFKLERMARSLARAKKR